MTINIVARGISRRAYQAAGDGAVISMSGIAS